MLLSLIAVFRIPILFVKPLKTGPVVIGTYLSHALTAFTAHNDSFSIYGMATIAPCPSWSAFELDTKISNPWGKNFKHSTVNADNSLRRKAPIKPNNNIALSRSFCIGAISAVSI